MFLIESVAIWTRAAASSPRVAAAAQRFTALNSA
jgi:hypothetical protein